MPQQESPDRQVQVQVYLLKDQVTCATDAVRDTGGNIRIRPLRVPLEGSLFTKASFQRKPEWATFLESGIDGELEELKTASASGLVVLTTDSRWFAITCGYGKSLMNPIVIDRRFGLRVALNSIDPDQLRAVDSRTVEEMTLHVRRQASRSSEVSSFGLDTSKDLLRGVTGTPRDNRLGARISGSESLTLSAHINLMDIPELCSRLLQIYGGTEYKDRFEWIDHLQLVTDPAVLEVLESALARSLATRDMHKMHLAPPEALDWQNVSGFYYWDPTSAPRHGDLDIEDAIQEISEHTNSTIDGRYLRQRHLWVEFRENAPIARYTLHSALVFETEIDGRLYVLSDGDWHEIDLDWANGIRQQVSGVPASTVEFPPALSGEDEPSYNIRAADILHAFSMDRCIVRFGPGNDQFEFCDIFTTNRQLIHVKRKTQSATLSHLFMQGQNSAQLLAHDSSFRERVREKAASIGINIEDLVPIDRIEASRYEIVFAVVTKPRTDWPRSLPFFSQLSLVGASTNIKNLGFQISLALITIDAT